MDGVQTPEAARPLPPPPVAPRRSTNATTGWIIGGVALCLVLLFVVFLCGTCFVISTVFRASEFHGGGVGLIHVTGVLSSDSSGITGGTVSTDVVEQLYQAEKNDNIKAVLIRIDSPGGTPAAAQEIYQQIKQTSLKKPVLASIGDTGASGAYYIASATNRIFADPDSDVGSIGVILEIPNIQGLDDKIGVHWFVYTQGQFKDIGSPLRPPTPQEEVILREQMAVAYNHFIRDVALGRHMDEAKVRNLATGLTFPGTQAKELGLIDNIGNYREAVTRAGRMGGIKGDVQVISLQSGGVFGIFSQLLTTFKEMAGSLKKLVGGSGATDQSPPQER